MCLHRAMNHTLVSWARVRLPALDADQVSVKAQYTELESFALNVNVVALELRKFTRKKKLSYHSTFQ